MSDGRDRTTPQVETTMVDHPKWIALAFTLLGILAWTAGWGYNEGAWGVVGWDAHINKASLQETALTGFMGTFVNWIYACGYVIALALYYLFLDIGYQAMERAARPRWRLVAALLAFLRRFPRPSASAGKLGDLLVGGTVAMFCFVMFPFLVWVGFAQVLGAEQMKSRICQVRAMKALPSTAVLGNGKLISGVFLARSETMSVMLTPSFIYAISVGEHPRVSDVTDVRTVQCPSWP